MRRKGADFGAESGDFGAESRVLGGGKRRFLEPAALRREPPFCSAWGGGGEGRAPILGPEMPILGLRRHKIGHFGAAFSPTSPHRPAMGAFRGEIAPIRGRLCLRAEGGRGFLKGPRRDLRGEDKRGGGGGEGSTPEPTARRSPWPRFGCRIGPLGCARSPSWRRLSAGRVGRSGGSAAPLPGCCGGGG